MITKINRSDNYTENEIETLVGGYNNYCKVWSALKDEGLRFIINTPSDSVVIFAMTKKKIISCTLSLQEFKKLAMDIHTNSMITLCTKSIGLKLGQSAPTASLVETSQSHRVLWAFTVRFLSGELDRLYDDCWEMGDVEEVNKAVSYLEDNFKDILLSDLSISMAKSAINESVSGLFA